MVVHRVARFSFSKTIVWARRRVPYVRNHRSERCAPIVACVSDTHSFRPRALSCFPSAAARDFRDNAVECFTEATGMLFTYFAVFQVWPVGNAKISRTIVFGLHPRIAGDQNHRSTILQKNNAITRVEWCDDPVHARKPKQAGILPLAYV